PVDSIEGGHRQWVDQWKQLESYIYLNSGINELWLSMRGDDRLDTLQVVPVVPDAEEESYKISFQTDNEEIEIVETHIHGGHVASFKINVPYGYELESVSGCGAFGSQYFYSTIWWTEPMSDDCEVNVVASPFYNVADFEITAVPGDGMVTVYWPLFDDANTYD